MRTKPKQKKTENYLSLLTFGVIFIVQPDSQTEHNYFDLSKEIPVKGSTKY